MMRDPSTTEIVRRVRDDDGLEAFPPERRADQAPRAEPLVDAAAAPSPAAAPVLAQPIPGPSRAVRPVTVHDLLVRQVPVAWFEAVAIVVEASEVSAAGGADALFPDAAGIVLTSNGAVLLRQGRSRGQPVAALCRTLHALLASASGVPAGLRLLVTAAGDAYPTTADFAGALAYYARPDRNELIRAVVERCSAVPVPAPAEGAPQPEASRPAQTPRRRRWRMPRWALAAAVVACVIGALAGVSWLWPAGARDVRPVANAVAQAQGLVKALGAGVRSTLGIGAAAPPAPAAVPSRPGRARAARERQTASSLRERSLASPSGSLQVPSREVEAPGGTGPLPSAAPAARERLPVTGPTETVFVRAEKLVYTSDDEDVRPPVMTYPQLQQSALPEAASPIVNTLELLVREDGTVERVRMLSRPRRMSDMMILSGVKMWRFLPASRAGRPVKYLTVLNWTVTP